jgi:hypothetical protein
MPGINKETGDKMNEELDSQTRKSRMRKITNMIADTVIMAFWLLRQESLILQQFFCDALLRISGHLAMVAVTVFVPCLARKALSSSISP